MNFFDEITKEKRDLPKKNDISFSGEGLNFYQIFAIGLFIIIFFLGIFFGNLFATCQATSFFYSDECIVTEFNFSVMIFVWFLGLLLSLFIYAIGHIVGLLKEISKKLDKLK